MRRKDREVTNEQELLQILSECKVCRVAVQDEAGLYIVPLNFGYRYQQKKLTLYFHSAKEGRKVRAFAQNPKIAFETDCGHKLIEGNNACEYGYAFKSIIGSGQISIVDNPEEKKTALAELMKHQTGKNFEFDDSMAGSVLVYKVDVENFTGKQKKGI